MHVNRILKSSLAFAGAAVILSACADSAKDPVSSVRPGDVMLNLGDPLNEVSTAIVEFEYFKVCKDYTSGTPQDVTIDVAAVDNDDATNTDNTSVTLSDGQCKRVWIAGGTGATVTVTEQVPTGFTASWAMWDDVGDDPASDPADHTGNTNSATNSVGGNLSPEKGTTVIFYNAAIPPGTQGCTPGYWKQSQHFDSWVGYAPTDLFESVFGRNVPGNPTLLDALGANGGGLNALMRHTVAALLNSSNPNVNYGPVDVIAAFQAAFDSGNYEAQKDIFAGWNERGCPLN